LEGKNKIALPGFRTIDKDISQILEKDRTTQQISQRNKRIFNKLERTWKQTSWQPFIPIKVSTVIFIAVLLASLKSKKNIDVVNLLKQLSKEHTKELKHLANLWTKKKPEVKSFESIITGYEKADKLYDKFKLVYTKKQGKLTEIMQNYGDELRSFGEIFHDPKKESVPHPRNLFKLPEALRRLIKAYREIKNADHFVIDAFRNPLEIEYFKWRYSEFYLLAVLRNQKQRHASLDLLKVDKDKIDKRESNRANGHSNNIGKWIGQDLNECISKGDLFIENIFDENKEYPYLKYNLTKIVCLANNPGCIPPTQDERAMQMAMTARQMSGCISRRVGAVIVNEEGYLTGFGWNDPPRGQPACSLRTARELIEDPSRDVFSTYEQSPKFKNHVKNNCILDLPFCFRSELKSIDNGQNSEKKEFTRALHAEENALFQATRNSRQDLRGCMLYTTDQPCNLCAKKAYQLGINRIVYIQEYPGIANEQTIEAGNRIIKVERFQGVIGSAFFKLFTNLMPEKDIIAWKLIEQN
jgi:dCMP deaminase